MGPGGRRLYAVRANQRDREDRSLERDLGAVAAGLGDAARAERERRRLRLWEVAAAAGMSVSAVHAVEVGRVASLETYVRLARALRLKPQFELADPRRRSRSGRAQDPVHAAMGEMEAARFRSLGFEVRLDEPFQHYQFAGRGDLLAWSIERALLLHIENRTAFPNLQEAFGAFNAKCAYLGADLAYRIGIKRWRSETHVMAILWSSEILRIVKQHRASFESIDRNGPAILEAWWLGEPPTAGRLTTAVLLDPLQGRRRDAALWTGISELARIRPRYRGYADAAAALMDTGQA
jgi:transcriptional regulator with XRE-family HTH domain